MVNTQGISVSLKKGDSCQLGKIKRITKMDLKITKHFMTGVSLVKGGLALLYIFINVPIFLSFIYFFITHNKKTHY